MYQPKIANHWTPQEAEATLQMIQTEAASLSESEITAKVQELMAKGDRLAFGVVHDPKLQSSQDRMFSRWIKECSEMAAMWCTVEGAA